MVTRGNTDNLRDGILSVFQVSLSRPSPLAFSSPELTKNEMNDKRQPSTLPPQHRSKAAPTTSALVRQAIARSDPRSLSLSSTKNPLSESYNDRSEVSRGRFLFYHDEGGIRASDEMDEDVGVIYYLVRYFLFLILLFRCIDTWVLLPLN
jgi:1-phosphatidylinositol-4-phosphate 5-kinase